MNFSILLSVITALAWGAQSIFLKKAMRDIPLTTAILISLIINFFVLLLLVGVSPEKGFSVFIDISAPIYFYFMVAGFLNYLLGRGLYYSSFRFISVIRSTSISSTYPIISVGFAILALGEKLALHQWVGVVLTLSGTYLLMMRGKR